MKSYAISGGFIFMGLLLMVGPMFFGVFPTFSDLRLVFSGAFLAIGGAVAVLLRKKP